MIERPRPRYISCVRPHLPRSRRSLVDVVLVHTAFMFGACSSPSSAELDSVNDETGTTSVESDLPQTGDADTGEEMPQTGESGVDSDTTEPGDATFDPESEGYAYGTFSAEVDGQLIEWTVYEAGRRNGNGACTREVILFGIEHNPADGLPTGGETGMRIVSCAAGPGTYPVANSIEHELMFLGDWGAGETGSTNIVPPSDEPAELVFEVLDDEFAVGRFWAPLGGVDVPTSITHVTDGRFEIHFGKPLPRP